MIDEQSVQLANDLADQKTVINVFNSGICEHGRQRSVCKNCGGPGICEHGRQRRVCKDCGGPNIWEHGRVRSVCKESKS